MSLLTIDDVQSAWDVIVGKLPRTPVITSEVLGNILDVRLFFKAELFQKTGSFKVRGALNKLNSLTPQEKAVGVIAFSAGNHAAGLAYAAALSGIQATIVMPEHASQSKVEATRRYGGHVILHGGPRDLFPKVQELQREHGYTLIHPFDDPFTIAGQGTVALELLEDVRKPDVVIVPIGGGGLISGMSVVIKALHPSTKVIGVEPVGAAGMRRALDAGAVVPLEKVETIADGLGAPFAGQLNLEHVQQLVDDVVLLTDDEIAAGLRLQMERTKLMAEPAGAAAFAALLHRKFPVAPGATVVCIVSGGNVDLNKLKAIL
ncbi:MAG: threonine/serine dehydratase [Anaerolineae bacterium]